MDTKLQADPLRDPPGLPCAGPQHVSGRRRGREGGARCCNHGLRSSYLRSDQWNVTTRNVKITLQLSLAKLLSIDYIPSRNFPQQLSVWCRDEFFNAEKQLALRLTPDSEPHTKHIPVEQSQSARLELGLVMRRKWAQKAA